MNGFLVSGSCAIDDIPLGLFRTRKEAKEFARHINEEKVVAQATKFGLHTSIVFGVDVVEFRGGLPIGRSMVVDFEESGA